MTEPAQRMKHAVLVQTVLWSGLYLLAVLLPLAAVMVGQTPPGRSFLVEVAIALGIVGYAMFALQFATTSRFRWIAPWFGTDAKMRFHRETGLIAVSLVLAHVVLLVVARPRILNFLNPASNLPRAISLNAALAAMFLLIALPLGRKALRMSYEKWRVTHGVLALLLVGVGLAHSLQIGRYVSGPAKQALWIVLAAGAAGLLFDTRFVRPLLLRRKPWRVTGVHPVCRDVWSLTLEAGDHAGMNFRGGQYAWLTLGDARFTLQQHPFSLASSDGDPRRIEFGIKEVGDFTSAIGNVQLETPAFVDGPYGAFQLDPSVEGAVFIAGGIGVVPMLSVLRSCRDRGDPRPFMLIYANNHEDGIAFRDELDGLAQTLDLEVVHTLDTPPENWRGESGRVTPDLLARRLASRKGRDLQFFVCGPTPMMDAVERILLERGVPPWRLSAERFDLV